jgi:DNA-binding GntR family transcriptional regulator
MKAAAPIPFRLDPDDTTALYLQIARRLSEAVRAGYYKVNDALPSERTLAETLAVSRVTARKALAHLAGNGLIHRVRGSGNYIAPLERIFRGPHQARLPAKFALAVEDAQRTPGR